jgi:hypothetical protein
MNGNCGTFFMHNAYRLQVPSSFVRCIVSKVAFWGKLIMMLCASVLSKVKNHDVVCIAAFWGKKSQKQCPYIATYPFRIVLWKFLFIHVVQPHHPGYKLGFILSSWYRDCKCKFIFNSNNSVKGNMVRELTMTCMNSTNSTPLGGALYVNTNPLTEITFLQIKW